MGDPFEARIVGEECLCRYVAADTVRASSVGGTIPGRAASEEELDRQPLAHWQRRAQDDMIELDGPDGESHPLSLEPWRQADPWTTYVTVALVCVPKDLLPPDHDNLDYWVRF